MTRSRWQRLLSAALYALTGLIGLIALTYPFFLPLVQEATGPGVARAEDAPLLTTILLVLSLLALLVETQGEIVSAKIVAALGILVAITAVLRFLEVAIPGPGGFSPIFTPIILAGYVFGARFGFLMGVLSLLTSALITGGVGPWLPYQMFTAGWVGLTAGWLPHPRDPRWEVVLLAGTGFAWGIIFGVIVNLYFWPFIAGGSGWEPGVGLGTALARYGTFYLTTSLLWDVTRGAGNVLLLAMLGRPTVQALSRFRDRFQFTYQPEAG